MSATTRFARRYLVVPLALLLANYMSVVSVELLADDYGVVIDPTIPPSVQPGPGTAQDVDASAVEKAHRERIMTRTVRCTEGCAKPDVWGSFLDISYEKQQIAADPGSQSGDQRSKDRVLTAGIDRQFGKHLFGFSLGASDGEGEVELDLSGFGSSNAAVDNTLNTERDKYSAGLYYGLQLPRFVTLGAQVMTTRDRYYSTWFDPRISSDDSARYDGDGYSASIALSAIVPLIYHGFSFLFQPSVSYQYVKSGTDPYTSEQAVSYTAREQRSDDLEIAFKWRAPWVVGQSMVLPFGGFAYSHLDRRNNGQELGGADVFVRREHELFEGLLGLTVQRGPFNATASFRKTVGNDALERERYQLILRVRF